MNLVLLRELRCAFLIYYGLSVLLKLEEYCLISLPQYGLLALASYKYLLLSSFYSPVADFQVASVLLLPLVQLLHP